jgi:DUF917 family protein
VPLVLQREDLAALARGFAMLGAGGAGSPHLSALVLDSSAAWPIIVHSPDELEPDRPCVAVGYGGSTLLLAEQLPGLDPFGPAIRAVERWLGVRDAVICGIEAAGINGLATLQLAGERDIVDADCMGRALPDFDQLSLLVDGLPGIVAAASAGPAGVAVVEGARPRDVERVIRTAIECNGGWAGTAFGGFTVGDLTEHTVTGTLARALAVGRASADAVHTDLTVLADVVGGRLLGTGRVIDARHERSAPGVVSFEVQADDGAVLRLVARSELVALVRNGIVVAATPTIIVAFDASTMAVLEVDQLAVGKDLVLLSLPAPAWWLATPGRRRQAEAVHWGIDGLEEVG